jgi:hypothetical protein
MYRCVSCSTGPNLPVREGSGVAKHHVAPNLTTLRGRASRPPHVMQLWTPRPCSGGLWGRHALCGTRPRFPTRRAPEAPRIPQHWTRPPSVGGLQGRGVSRYTWEMNKEVPGYNG